MFERIEALGRERAERRARELASELAERAGDLPAGAARVELVPDGVRLSGPRVRSDAGLRWFWAGLL